uniref:mevalonate kinase n=1 Tax=Streptomyces sp. WT6 TaxID=1486372 RepID=A0A023PZP1_9ACTN|nr:hypothetical protein wt6.19c [Streptomyces sp. WT6]
MAPRAGGMARSLARECSPSVASVTHLAVTACKNSYASIRCAGNGAQMMGHPVDGLDPVDPYSACGLLRNLYRSVRPAREVYAGASLSAVYGRAGTFDVSVDGRKVDQERGAPSVVSAGSGTSEVTATPNRPADLVGVGEAHGKVILLGEHAVVYGAPGVALSVPSAACRAEARFGPPASRGLVSFRLLAADSVRSATDVNVPAGLRVLVASCLRRAAADPPCGIGLTLHSAIPVGCGLGSSAAYARACAVAMGRLLELRLGPSDVFDLTQEAEQVSHGRSSGIDAHATGGRGLLMLDQGVVRAPEVSGQAWVVVADSGTSGSTREAVEMLRASFALNPVRRRSFLTRSRRLTAEGLDGLASGRPKQLGRALTGTHTLLMEQGLVNGPVRVLVDGALAAGALGAKMTGGGLGGCVLALAGTPAQAELLVRRLRRYGARRTWIAPLLQNGDSR